MSCHIMQDENFMKEITKLKNRNFRITERASSTQKAYQTPSQ
ncbi:5672_t:CDS:1, partial [Funneliformis geosporum]